MNMILWNFLEALSEVKRAVVHIENYRIDYDGDGTECHTIEVNVEDADEESIVNSYIIAETSHRRLIERRSFFVREYLQGENIVEIIQEDF